MPIIQACYCCCTSVRQLAYAAGIYSMVSSILWPYDILFILYFWICCYSVIYKKSNIILSFTSLSNNSCLQIVSTVGFFDFLVCESAELCSKPSTNTHESREEAIHQVVNLNLFEINKYIISSRMIKFIIDN